MMLAASGTSTNRRRPGSNVIAKPLRKYPTPVNRLPVMRFAVMKTSDYTVAIPNQSAITGE